MLPHLGDPWQWPCALMDFPSTPTVPDILDLLVLLCGTTHVLYYVNYVILLFVTVIANCCWMLKIKDSWFLKGFLIPERPYLGILYMCLGHQSACQYCDVQVANDIFGMHHNNTLHLGVKKCTMCYKRVLQNVITKMFIKHSLSDICKCIFANFIYISRLL